MGRRKRSITLFNELKEGSKIYCVGKFMDETRPEMREGLYKAQEFIVGNISIDGDMLNFETQLGSMTFNHLPKDKGYCIMSGDVVLCASKEIACEVIHNLNHRWMECIREEINAAHERMKQVKNMSRIPFDSLIIKNHGEEEVTA